MSLNSKPQILFDNRFLDATPTATDTAADYDVLNIRDLRAYTFWKAASAGIKYITINCGTAKNASGLGIAGHNFKTIGAAVSVESSPDNTTWTERLAPFIPANDFALMKVFTEVSAQYWRVKLGAGSAAPYIAILILGTPLVFERYLIGDFDPDGQEIMAQSTNSKTGHLLGTTINYIRRNVSARWSLLTPAWIKNYFLPAWNAHLAWIRPFFWAWEITNHPDEVYWVRLNAESVLAMPYDPVRRSLSLDFEGLNEEVP